MPSTVPDIASNDPLHGVTLKEILTTLVEEIGWGEMAAAVPLRCFEYQPSVTSSLKVLRKTPWARTRVEELYVRHMRHR